MPELSNGTSSRSYPGKRSVVTTSLSGRRSPRGQAGFVCLPMASMKLVAWSSTRAIGAFSRQAEGAAAEAMELFNGAVRK